MSVRARRNCLTCRPELAPITAALRALPSGPPATLRNDRRLHRLPVGGASRTARESCNDLYGWWTNRAAPAQAPADALSAAWADVCSLGRAAESRCKPTNCDAAKV